MPFEGSGQRGFAAYDPDLVIVDFDAADERPEPVLASAGVTVPELVLDEARERRDFFRRDRGLLRGMRRDLVKCCHRNISLLLETGQTLLEVTVQLNDPFFNGTLEPTEAHMRNNEPPALITAG